MPVPMHLQVLLARMLGRNRKRGIYFCGNRESQQAKETYHPQSRDRDLGQHPGRLRARQCNDVKAVRGAAKAAPTTAVS